MKKLFSIFFALALLLPVSIQAQTDDLHIPQAAKSPEAIQVETLETSTKCVAIADYRSNSSYRLFQMQIYITAAGGEAVSYCFCVAAKVSSPYTGWTSTTFDKSNSSIYTYNALPSSNTIDGTKRATASTVTGSVTRVWGNYYLANVYITFTTSPYNKTYHLKSYFLAPNTESAFAQDSESSVLNLGVDMNDGATTTQSGTTTKLQTQGTSYAGVYTYNWTANVVFPNMNKAYVPTGSYTIDNTGSNGTVSASTANANYSKSIVECCIPNVQCFYWHPRSGNVVIINPNHVSDPMYFQMLFNNTYFGNASYTQLLVRNSIPSLYSLTVSTAGTGANGSASISCAEGHGYPSGGFLSGSSGDYYYEGTTVTLVAPSANPGYHFVNWTKGGSSVSTSQTYDLGNVSSSNSGAYVANFDANTYNVVFNANGGSGTMSNQSHTYGQSKALTTNAFTRTGYAFRGWATSADRANAGTVDYTDGQSVSNLTTTNNGTYNLYAVWAELVTFTIASYSNGTVTVTPNDDSGSFTSGSRDLAVGTVVTFSAVANTNYHITNVNLNIKGSDNSFSASSAYTLKTGDGTVTLTANFLPDTYAITYNAGENGTGADIAAGEKTYNEDFTLSNSTFTREGYTQTGWSTEDGGSKAYDLGDTYTGNTALDLYPYWEINTYDITFKNADGTTLKKSDDTTDAVYSVAYGETPAYDGATPTKAADSEYTYTFNAWTPAIATVTTAATYTATYDSTKVKYTLTWDFAGGATTSETGDYTNGLIDWGTNITAPANPTKSGYTFNGWDADNDGTADNVVATMPTSDVTYKALWNAVSTDLVLKDGVTDGQTDIDFDEFKATYNGQTMSSVTLNRTFTAGNWATICLPFDVDRSQLEASGLLYNVYEFRYATGSADAGKQVTFHFRVATSMEAGRGYLVKGESGMNTSFTFTGVTINTSADTQADVNDLKGVNAYYDKSVGSDIAIVGVLRSGTLRNDDRKVMGLANNKIWYPHSSGNPMPAYRAYFYNPNASTSSVMPRVRIVVEGEGATELEVVDGELYDAHGNNADGDVGAPRKYIRNGVLIIERNGVRYDAQGKRL